VEGDATQVWYFLHYKNGAAVEKFAINKGLETETMFPTLPWLEKNGYEVTKIEQKVGDAVILSDQYFHWCEVVGVSTKYQE
jgi:JmjC domain, hydroxylase